MLGLRRRDWFRGGAPVTNDGSKAEMKI